MKPPITLEQFKSWLIELQNAINSFLSNKQLFLECFWGNWKSESLTVVHLSALLTDIMHRRLSIFYESQLDALLHSKCKDQPVLKEQILI